MSVAPPNAGVAARGIPVTLADGRVVRLRYGMEGLLDLEHEFGSVSRTVPYVRGSASVMALDLGMDVAPEERALAERYDGPGFLSVILTALGAGLHHEGLTRRADLLPLVDTTRLREYVTAVLQAYEQAFDAGKAPVEGQAPVDPTSGGSPSVSGGTPPSDVPVSALTSSGG